jgi:isopenicillin N synthase-like dioxygenase
MWVLITVALFRYASALSVPVVDMAPLLGIRQRQHAETVTAEVSDAVERIDHALRTMGCFVAINSRVGNDVSSGAFSASSSLFGLGADTLQASAITKGGFMRGYLPFGRESGLSTYFEPKEGFSYGFEWGGLEDAKTNALHGDNVWPGDLGESDRKGLQNLFALEVETAEDLATAIFLSLRQRNNATDFHTYLDDRGKTSVMRLFHYLARDVLAIGDEVDNKVVMGSSPHTDWGFLTLILQDDVGGLQFKYKDQWVDVPYIPGSLIVNCGDFLHVISGGRYHSPVHRVISPRARDRTSFVLFYYPRFETPMDPELFERIHISTNSHAEGEADADTAVISATVAAAAEGEGGAHNSLFRIVTGPVLIEQEGGGDGQSEAAKGVPCFGEYIIEKWREVKAY